VRIRFCREGEVAALAQIHASAFPVGWDAGQLDAFLASPGVSAQVVEYEGELVAFVLTRIAACEAEVLTLAIAPAHRRKGLASALLGAAVVWARNSGARQLFLEVASQNQAALTLYRNAGFAMVGARAAYYARDGGGDALVLRLDLNS